MRLALCCPLSLVFTKVVILGSLIPQLLLISNPQAPVYCSTDFAFHQPLAYSC